MNFFISTIFKFGIVFKSAVEDLIVANNVRQCVGLCKTDEKRNDDFHKVLFILINDDVFSDESSAT